MHVQLAPRGGVPAPGPARQAALPGRPVQEGPWHQRLLQGPVCVCLYPIF